MTDQSRLLSHHPAQCGGTIIPARRAGQPVLIAAAINADMKIARRADLTPELWPNKPDSAM